MTESGSHATDGPPEAASVPSLSAEASAALVQSVMQLLVEGRIVLRIESAEVSAPDVHRNLELRGVETVRRLDVPAPADIGLGRRLAQAAFSWCFICPADTPFRIDRS